ncbi:MAG: hypothetical protein EB082_08570 [Verrucomicrobia bacterium]|nr:hypothetical protein [Verrucomicrobiota bacterium]
MGGKYGRIIDAILAELRALRPVPGINTFAGQNSIGTSRTVQPVGAAPIIQQLTVQIEGADALLCTDADGNDVYVMKPYTLQATQWVNGGGRQWTPIAAVTTSQFVTVGGTDYPVKGT